MSGSVRTPGSDMKRWATEPVSLFPSEVNIAPVETVLKKVLNRLDEFQEITVVHDPGDPGAIHIYYTWLSMEHLHYHDSVPKTIVLDEIAILRRRDADRYYRVLASPRMMLDPLEGAALTADELTNINTKNIYDTIDTIRYTPLRLPDAGGTEGALEPGDGVDLLVRKLHHQINQHELEPKRWHDVLFDYRRGELDTDGMVSTATAE